MDLNNFIHMKKYMYRSEMKSLQVLEQIETH